MNGDDWMDSWTDDWMKEFYDPDIGLRLAFEKPDDDDTDEDKLYAIACYAEAHNLPEAAKRAAAAKNTGEDILPILAMIGFTFDGKKLKPLSQSGNSQNREEE